MMKYSLDETAIAQRNHYAFFKHTVCKHVEGFGLRKGAAIFFQPFATLQTGAGPLIL